MFKQVLTMALALAGTAAMACPDGMKTMDAKAPASEKLAISQQPVWSQARNEAPKAKLAKTGGKPAVAAAGAVEAKKSPGV